MINKLINFFKDNIHENDINISKLKNPKNWHITAEYDESYEYDGYIRKPQRHYRHKIYTNYWINESYENKPRDVKRVVEIFMEDFNNDNLLEDTFCYICHNR